MTLKSNGGFCYWSIVCSWVSFNLGNRERSNNSWPKGRGKFLHFVLHKTDGDLSAIFSQVGDLMGGSKKERGGAGKFKIAGLKDRRGRTSQVCLNFFKS